MRKVKKIDIPGLPPVLEKDIDTLVDAINSNKEFIDCEMGEVLGDINQCESCKLIGSSIARTLRDYYINGGIFENG